MSLVSPIKVARLLMLLMLVPIISIGTVLYQSYSNVEYTKTMHENLDNELNNYGWLSVYSVLRSTQKLSEIQANDVKDEIESKLLRAYVGNMEQLKVDLAGTENNKAYDIINTVIADKYILEKNEENRMWIASQNGIIADHGLASSNKRDRSWDSEIRSSLDSGMAQDAIRRLLNQKTAEPILIRIHGDPGKSENYNTEPNTDFLKDEFMSGGMYALRDYDMLVPAYITDTGDIFGVPDVTHNGIRNNNNKLIIVQQFNLYDAVEHYNDMNLFHQRMLEVNNNNMKNDLNRIMINTVITCVIMTLAFIALLASTIVCLKWGKNNERNRRTDRYSEYP